MELPAPLTRLETLELMILEEENELTKHEIMLDVNNKMITVLDAGLNSQGQQITIALKRTIAGSKKKLELLRELHKKEVAELATDAIIS